VTKSKNGFGGINPGLAEMEITLPTADLAQAASGNGNGDTVSLPMRVNALRAQLSQIQGEARG